MHASSALQSVPTLYSMSILDTQETCLDATGATGLAQSPAASWPGPLVDFMQAEQAQQILHFDMHAKLYLLNIATQQAERSAARVLRHRNITASSRVNQSRHVMSGEHRL